MSKAVIYVTVTTSIVQFLKSDADLVKPSPAGHEDLHLLSVVMSRTYTPIRSVKTKTKQHQRKQKKHWKQNKTKQNKAEQDKKKKKKKKQKNNKKKKKKKKKNRLKTEQNKAK